MLSRCTQHINIQVFSGGLMTMADERHHQVQALYGCATQSVGQCIACNAGACKLHSKRAAGVCCGVRQRPSDICHWARNARCAHGLIYTGHSGMSRLEHSCSTHMQGFSSCLTPTLYCRRLESREMLAGALPLMKAAFTLHKDVDCRLHSILVCHVSWERPAASWLDKRTPRTCVTVSSC